MIIGLIVVGTFDDNLCSQAYRLYMQQRYGFKCVTMDEAVELLKDRKLDPKEHDILVELVDYNDTVVFKATNDAYKVIGITQTTDALSLPIVELLDQTIVHDSTIQDLEAQINDAVINLAEQVGVVSTKIRRGFTRDAT